MGWVLHVKQIQLFGQFLVEIVFTMIKGVNSRTTIITISTEHCEDNKTFMDWGVYLLIVDYITLVVLNMCHFCISILQTSTDNGLFNLFRKLAGILFLYFVRFYSLRAWVENY